MGRIVVSPAVACLAAFSTLVKGVMAESLDSDLIGVVAAGVCITVLIIVIIAFIACCCYRRIESDRKSVLMRKDSGSVSTNGVTPRWVPSMVPSGMPVYAVPAEPMMYAVPASHYYLGHYAPKFMDAEALDVSQNVYMQHQSMDHRAKMEEEEREEEEEEVRRERHSEYVAREERETQEVVVREETTAEVVQTDAPAQLNEQAANEFSASSLNYRVIRKQHKHEKMPEWLRKSYAENEQSMNIDEDSSRSSDDFPALDLTIPPTAEEMVRAQVSPHHSFLDSGEVLKVPEGFTIVDYVDPDNQPRTSSYVLNDAGGEDYRLKLTTDTRRPADVPTPADVSITRDVSTTLDVSTVSTTRDFSITRDFSTTRDATISRDVSATRDVAVVSDVTRRPADFAVVSDVTRRPADFAVVSDVTRRPADFAVVSDVTAGGSKKTTVVTTTTYYNTDGKVEEVTRDWESAHVPPASTSSPRPPPPPLPPPPPPPPMETWGVDAYMGSGDLSHYRMRKPGDGSLSNLPQAVASTTSYIEY